MNLKDYLDTPVCSTPHVRVEIIIFSIFAYHIDNSGDEARCGLVLDFGTCLRRIPAHLLQYIFASRKMEIKENITKMNRFTVT